MARKSRVLPRVKEKYGSAFWGTGEVTKNSTAWRLQVFRKHLTQGGCRRENDMKERVSEVLKSLIVGTVKIDFKVGAKE